MGPARRASHDEHDADEKEEKEEEEQSARERAADARLPDRRHAPEIREAPKPTKKIADESKHGAILTRPTGGRSSDHPTSPRAVASSRDGRLRRRIRRTQ